jgi:hypothetical protein
VPRIAYRRDVPTEQSGSFSVISSRVLATICLFHDPVFGFPADLLGAYLPTWHQWLHILWVAFTVIMIIPWRAISKHKRERREWLVAEEERK